ncbi:MAG: Fic family protein [Candidatus Margulisbacteria bacterium]|jgi:Fic family protein|nr:Fic family protein [Candidatus Margulisiibacteriota bacterium]
MHSGKYIVTSSGYRAFLPISLQDVEKQLKLDHLQKLIERANIAIGELRALEALLPNPKLLTERYATREALLSSQIEGTQSTLIEIFENENNARVGQDIREVQNYFKALQYGIDNIKNGVLPLSVRLLKDCHAILLEDVRGGEAYKTRGELRRSQNWIGGASPANAKFVPPPAEYVVPLMSDLEKYFYQDRAPSAVKIALIHYQFETIHPFLDGNGRIGRLLISLFLIAKAILKFPTLYLSLYLKKMKTEYYDLLTEVREQGNYERWIEFFLLGITTVAKQIMDTTNKIIVLEKEDAALLSSKNEQALFQQLLRNPTTSIKNIEKFLGVTNKTANVLARKLEKLKILKRTNDLQRNKKYMYVKYLEIIETDL